MTESEHLQTTAHVGCFQSAVVSTTDSLMGSQDAQMCAGNKGWPMRPEPKKEATAAQMKKSKLVPSERC